MFRRLVRRVLGRKARPPATAAPMRAHAPAPRPQATTPVSAASSGPSDSTTRSGHVLALYKFDACPYCRRVQRVLDTLDLDVEMRDTRLDPAHRQALFARTGRTQVPCLFIDGEPMFESEDIVVWLETYAAQA